MPIFSENAFSENANARANIIGRAKVQHQIWVELKSSSKKLGQAKVEIRSKVELKSFHGLFESSVVFSCHFFGRAFSFHKSRHETGIVLGASAPS